MDGELRMEWLAMNLNRTGSRRNARRVSTVMRVEALESRQLLATFSVMNTLDSGPGSLREAVAGVNASADQTNAIAFNISGAGVQSIKLLSPLDPISKPVVLNGTNGNSTPSIELDGTSAGSGADGLRLTGGASTVTGLIINRFKGNGITISNIGGDTVTNTWIGVNSTDTADATNGGDGILISGVPNNFIGGTASGAKNVISGNSGSGVRITGAGAQNNVIQNSMIGTNLAGTLNLGNATDGVRIENNASNNSIGGVATNQGDTIAFNAGSGVNVISGTGNNIRRNSMFSNSQKGIVLGTGANDNQVAPTLTSSLTTGGITTVTGTLTGTPNSVYTVELFSNTEKDPSGFGEGRVFIGTTQVTIGSSGTGTFAAAATTSVAVNQFVSSTATSTTGDTSAFSNNVTNLAPSADVGITGSATPEPVAAGGFLTYTFTIHNAGPNDATNVTFLDTLPTNTSFVQAVASQGTVTRSSSVVTGTLGTLAAGSNATVTVTVVATTAGPLSNTGTVTASDDTSNSNNTATVTSTVQAGINLSVVGTTNPAAPTVGSPLTFVFTVTNTGSVAATNVVLTSTLPAGVTFNSTSATQGTSTMTNNVVTSNLGTLAVGGSAIVYVVVTPNATGTVSETATVKGDQPEINTQTQTTTATATVGTAPAPPGTEIAPTVTFLQRYGVHRSPTSLELKFSQPLNADTAQFIGNYTLVHGKSGKRIRLRKARYDALTQSVILTTVRPVNLHQLVTLTVNGSTSTGVANVDGVLLDGANTGKPGSNFVRTFKAFGPGPV